MSKQPQSNYVRNFEDCTRWGALHPIRAGATPTNGAHDQIGYKRKHGYESRTARPPPTGPTLRTISLTRGRSHGPHRRLVGIRPQ